MRIRREDYTEEEVAYLTRPLGADETYSYRALERALFFDVNPITYYLRVRLGWDASEASRRNAGWEDLYPENILAPDIVTMMDCGRGVREVMDDMLIGGLRKAVAVRGKRGRRRLEPNPRAFDALRWYARGITVTDENARTYDALAAALARGVHPVTYWQRLSIKNGRGRPMDPGTAATQKPKGRCGYPPVTLQVLLTAAENVRPETFVTNMRKHLMTPSDAARRHSSTADPAYANSPAAKGRRYFKDAPERHAMACLGIKKTTYDTRLALGWTREEAAFMPKYVKLLEPGNPLHLAGPDIRRLFEAGIHVRRARREMSLGWQLDDIIDRWQGTDDKMLGKG